MYHEIVTAYKANLIISGLFVCFQANLGTPYLKKKKYFFKIEVQDKQA